MASSDIIKGSVLKLESNKITIFDASGFTSGKKWALDFGLGIAIETDPNPHLPGVQQVINDDIQNGKVDSIHTVQVNPGTAVCLYLEGVISRDMVAKADVTDDSVTFENVLIPTSLGERQFRLTVRQNTDISVATLDSEGNIV